MKYECGSDFDSDYKFECEFVCGREYEDDDEGNLMVNVIERERKKVQPKSPVFYAYTHNLGDRTWEIEGMGMKNYSNYTTHAVKLLIRIRANNVCVEYVSECVYVYV